MSYSLGHSMLFFKGWSSPSNIHVGRSDLHQIPYPGKLVAYYKEPRTHPSPHQSWTITPFLEFQGCRNYIFTIAVAPKLWRLSVFCGSVHSFSLFWWTSKRVNPIGNNNVVISEASAAVIDAVIDWVKAKPKLSSHLVAPPTFHSMQLKNLQKRPENCRDVRALQISAD